MAAGKDRIGNDLGMATSSHYRDPHRAPVSVAIFQIDQ